MHPPLLTLTGFLAICATYVAGAWVLYRRGRRGSLLALWIGYSLAYGYVMYRWTCAQALTCDVSGTSSHFSTGNPRYFTMYVPYYAFLGLVTFGAASLFIRSRFRTHREAPLWPGTLGLGVLTAVGGWVAGMVAIGAARLLGAAV